MKQSLSGYLYVSRETENILDDSYTDESISIDSMEVTNCWLFPRTGCSLSENGVLVSVCIVRPLALLLTVVLLR